MLWHILHITLVQTHPHWLPRSLRLNLALRVHDWLLNNGLHLNPSKSEAIAFYNPRSKPREHSALPHLCQNTEKPPWQPPNHSHLLLRVSGMHCRIICRPPQLFLFLEELSNIIYSCLLTRTVLQNLVWSDQLNVSHFAIHCQLLPLHSPQIPCRPSKYVPSERLRLVKRFISHRLHTLALCSATVSSSSSSKF